MSFRTVVWMTCIITLACLAAAVGGAAAAADRSAGVCKPGITDDTLTPLPKQLVPRAQRLFGLDMPDDLIRKSTVYRCTDGKILLCTTGANLACGKANLSRDSPGAAAWCRDHAQSDFIPMFVTGHDTIYRWRCSGGRPQIEATADAADARGFVARNWQDAGPN